MATTARMLAGRDPLRRTLAALATLAALIGVMATSGSAAIGDTTRVSVSNSGIQGDEPSFEPSISADGRFVAFYSDARNLVANDTNEVRDVFVHDRQTGAPERVSVSGDETQSNHESISPSISSDGRFVAFSSIASNLVAGDTNARQDVFARDRQTGTTERVSVNSDEMELVGASDDPSISSDGRFVAFVSNAPFVAPDTDGSFDIFVRDRQTGTTERVSVDNSGNPGPCCASFSGDPSISSDGNLVAFYSNVALTPDDTNNSFDVYVRDRQAGATERVSVDSDEAQANAFSRDPSISTDGDFVAFRSGAANLVPNDTNARDDVFVRDRISGTTERVSVDSDETQATGGGSFSPSISSDGQFVSFSSEATNLVSGDANGQSDIFVRGRTNGTTERVSVDDAGVEGAFHSFLSSINSDGTFVAFDSEANNLVANDNNGKRDIFVRERGGADAPPMAANDEYATGEDKPLDVPAPGVLTNDTDDDPLTVASPRPASGPTNGALTLDEDGSFTYTPNPGFVGDDTFTYKATDGQVESDPATVTITVEEADGAPPETTITSGPPSLTQSKSASFSFNSTESGSTFECERDGEGFSLCSSPKSYANLSEGPHTFMVRAATAAGADPTPATRSWTVDAVKPKITALRPAPGSSTRSRTVGIQATVGDSPNNPAKSGIQLFLDGKRKTGFAYNQATGRLSFTARNISLGRHTVKVVATDAAGNVAARVWSFTVKKKR